MKKTLSVIIFLSALLNIHAQNFSVSAKEQEKMLEEADDMIDEMPDGLQDRISDAVSHALEGVYAELDFFRNYNDTTGTGKYIVTIKNITGGENGSTPMRIYSARHLAATSPILVYFHGGGGSVGSMKVADLFCRALASEGKVRVVSVEYPLAPQYPFPAALICGTEAIKYISAHKDLLDADMAAPLSIGGDGMGANIALTSYFKLIDSKSDIKIRSLVLYYPLLNMSGVLPSSSKREYGRGYGFDSRVWEAFKESYLSGNNKSGYPEYLISPGSAPASLLLKLPPTLLIAAGRDIVIEEEREFVKKSSKIKFVEFTGALHGFLTDKSQATAFNRAVGITAQFLSQ